MHKETTDDNHYDTVTLNNALDYWVLSDYG